jgi:molecular chaperone IbpA
MNTSLFPVNDVFKNVDRFFIGFDDQWNRLSKLHDDITKNVPNYPPYNIRKVTDNQYVIEIAVAGFSKSEITITLEDDRLIVKGSTDQNNNDNYLFRGIGLRDFTRTFAISDQIEVRGANILNGLLQIALERVIPEHKKPKTIHISDESTLSNPQLLTEEK